MSNSNQSTVYCKVHILLCECDVLRNIYLMFHLET